MPRVAVCMSGLMRTFEKTAPNLLLNIINPNKADLFISTWDKLGNAKHNLVDHKEFIETFDPDRISLTYGPALKGLEIESFDVVQPSLPKVFYPGMVSMYYKILAADVLRQSYEQVHGFTYDVVIRARPDLQFHTGFLVGEPSIFSDGVFIRFIEKYVIDDTFAIGRREAMQRYSSVFERISHYETVQQEFERDPTTGVLCTPEQVLRRHLRDCGVSVGTFPINATIERGEHAELFK